LNWNNSEYGVMNVQNVKIKSPVNVEPGSQGQADGVLRGF
jgi:hypothetical protein